MLKRNFMNIMFILKSKTLLLFRVNAFSYIPDVSYNKQMIFGSDNLLNNLAQFQFMNYIPNLVSHISVLSSNVERNYQTFKVHQEENIKGYETFSERVVGCDDRNTRFKLYSSFFCHLVS